MFDKIKAVGKVQNPRQEIDRNFKDVMKTCEKNRIHFFSLANLNAAFKSPKSQAD